MGLAARRITYSLAIGLFLIIAPIVVALTSGYRWTGLQTGFVKTGVLVVSSQPRAKLIVNGLDRSQTPKRMSGLAPGTYRVELQKDGYQSWSELIRVTANRASVVGPVRLFPSQPALTSFATGWSSVLHDHDLQLVVGTTRHEPMDQVTELWPTLKATPIDVTGLPEEVNRSPRGQTLILRHGQQQTVVGTNRTAVPWVIPSANDIAWTSESETVWWGRRGQDLIQFDSVTKTETPLVTVTSFTIGGGTLWYTQQTEESTILYRRPAIGDDRPILVESFDGHWELLPQVGGLVLRRSDRQAKWLRFDPLTQRLTPVDLGSIDQLWWPVADQPPIWIDGVSLMTLLKNQPHLLERSPNTYLDLRWVEVQKFMLAVEVGRVTIHSYGPEQGQGVVIDYPLTATQQVVGIATDQSTFVIHDAATGTLTEVHWDEPARSASQ